MDIAVRIALGVVLVIFVWWLLTPRRMFVVRIRDGRPGVVRGHVPSSFVADIGEVCREFGVSRGEVFGNRRGKQTVLAFSWTIPPPCRQRLRNLWQLGQSR